MELGQGAQFPKLKKGILEVLTDIPEIKESSRVILVKGECQPFQWDLIG